MKKYLALFLALLMALTGAAALAEEAVYDELVVGATTALSGCFFTDMWGSNTSDMDVRLLLHGYNLMEWKSAEATYGMDDSVVSGMVVTEDSAGNRTYTIALYDDLKYSDGTPITAWDYAFSILLSVAPELAAIGAATDRSDALLGAAEYRSGESNVLSGVRVLSDNQLSITIRAEYFPFFYELALLDYSPYPISEIAPNCEVEDDGEGVYIRNIAAHAAEEPIFTAELLAETILDSETGYLSHPDVVSGPYTLVRFDWETRTAEFAINEYYRGNSEGQKPSIAKITFRTVQKESMMQELESGEVDLLHKCVQAETLDAGMELVNASEGDFSVTNYPRSGFSFISFSCERPATQSRKVRQAIAHCFDKEAFVSDYVRNYGLSVDGYYGIGQWMVELVTGSMPAPLDAPDADATDAQLADYEAEKAQWEALSMENIRSYALDTDAAQALLIEDGWVLNREGEAYDPETDAVRCKEIDGEIVALELKIIYPEGNDVAAYLEGEFAQNLKQAGIKLTVEALPFTQLLEVYYRQSERDADMIYLATNFDDVFEPSETFNPDDAFQGVNNRSGIADETLYALACDLRQTEPGDVLNYCRKWIALQEYYSEALPALPIYSNVYFDFYTSRLQNYDISGNVSWATAIVGACLSDVSEGAGAEESDMEIVEAPMAQGE